MNLFCSIASRKSIIALLPFIIVIKYSHGSCVSLFDVCKDDCDCCGHDLNKNIRCELRNQGLGKRCYESKSVGQPCDINSQCTSQNCVNNICQPTHRPRPHNRTAFCPLVADPSDIVAPVDGSLPRCACHKGPTQDAIHAMDNDLSTDYVNYNSQSYSGFIVQPSFSAPLRKMEVCTSNANPENDPMCFRLYGKCEHENDFILLQDGNIPFGSSRQNCATILINGRQSYTYYKVEFGCRRGGYEESCQKSSHHYNFLRRRESRKLDTFCTGDYPIMLSEVKLSGKCNEGLPTPTKSPTMTPTVLPTSVPTPKPTYKATTTAPSGKPTTLEPTPIPTKKPNKLDPCSPGGESCPSGYYGQIATYDCKGFFDCINGNLYSEIPRSCPVGTLYDESLQTCDYEARVNCSCIPSENPCPSRYTGKIATNDCKGFLHCTNGKLLLETPQPCPGGTLFDERIQNCNWAANVKC